VINQRILTNAQILNTRCESFYPGEIHLGGGTIQRTVKGRSGDYPPDSEVIDLNGQFVLPGLIDAHIHLRKTALNLTKIDCETSTKQACLERVRNRAQTTPRGEWILGHGWNQNTWEDGFGTAADLDQAAPHHPVYLTAKSLHASWANSRALRAADLQASTPDPEGGQLSRDDSGNLTGILFENAMQLVERVLPEPDQDQSAEAISKAQDYLWKMGFTGVHDFDRSRCFSALQLLQEQARLKLRVLKQIYLDDFPGAAAQGLRTNSGSDFLKIGGVKIFADGALGPQTAALLAPYQGQGDNRGMLLYSSEELSERCLQVVDQGFSLAVHAIGDRANRVVLDTLEDVRRHEQKNQLPAYRHRIEHVQLLDEDDLGRLADLDVIASMQPIHAPSDRAIADRYWGRRARYAYAWKSLLERGTRLAFGSDAPVENPNPFWGIHAAVTRRGREQSASQASWYPEEALTRQQALFAYTQGSAYAAGWESRAGVIAKDRWADLIILEHNPLTCSLEQLAALSPAATMVNGAFVWKSF